MSSSFLEVVVEIVVKGVLPLREGRHLSFFGSCRLLVLELYGL